MSTPKSYRRLGLTAPSRANVWLGKRIPAWLCVAAILALLARTNTGFLIAVSLASAAAVIAAFLLIFRLKEFRLSWTLAEGLLLGYGVGSFNTSAKLLLAGTSAADYFSRPQGNLSIALAVALLAAALLFFGGAVCETPIRIQLSRLRGSDLYIVVIGAVVIGVAFATGGIGFMGVTSTAQHRESIAGSIADVLAPILPALAVLIQPKCRTPISRALLWIITAGAFLSLVPQGRRVLLYAVVMVLIAFGLRSRHGIKAIWIKLALAAAAIPLLYVANAFFYAMRVSSWSVGGTRAPLSMLMPRALGILEGEPDPRFEQRVDRNLRDRTFVIRYFSDLLAASWTHQPLYGRDIVFCFKSAMPSLLYSDKDEVREIGMEENLANPEFGLYARDEANSILTTGVSDFGIVGIFVYPIVLTVAVRLLWNMLSRWLPEAIKTVVLLSIVYLLWQTEVSTAAYIVLCRNLLLISLLLLFVSKALNSLHISAKRRDAEVPARIPAGRPARSETKWGRNNIAEV